MIVKLKLFYSGELDFVVIKSELEGEYRIFGNKVSFVFNAKTQAFTFGDRAKRADFTREFSITEENCIFSNIKNKIMESL